MGMVPRPRTVSCVLSGGGSRASFQIGALRYLYANDHGFQPTTFVGASAGAILAAGLSQYATREEQAAWVGLIHDIWHSLREPEEMFLPRPWLRKAQAELPGLLDLMGPLGTPVPPRPLASRIPFLKHTETPASPASPLDPVELALTPDAELRPEWSLGIVAQLAGSVSRLPRLGSDLAAIRLGMEQTRSMYRPGPVLQRLLDPEVFDETRVRDAGTTLRMAMVALETGELRYMRQDGGIVDRENREVDAGPYGLVTGLLASCAIPAVFRPVPIGHETYVDGGVRENLPAELAIGHLRAERTYVISSQSLGVPARASMADADLFSVVMRSTEILVDEGGRDELAYAHSADAVVIHPDISVHDAMAVHPGLIAINTDYGWMRAAEEVRRLGPDQEELTRRIVTLRMQALGLEERIFGGADDARTGARLAGIKTELRQRVAECDEHALPPGAQGWWRSFERHRDEPPFDPPWLEP